MEKGLEMELCKNIFSESRPNGTIPYHLKCGSCGGEVLICLGKRLKGFPQLSLILLYCPYCKHDEWVTCAGDLYLYIAKGIAFDVNLKINWNWV